jgi:nucleoside-diphosphate-sugar epimerase
MYVIGSRLKATEKRSVVPRIAQAETKLSFGTPSKEHDTNYDAVQEACRLAQENPTKEFFVFKAVAVATTTPPPPPPVELKEL